MIDQTAMIFDIERSSFVDGPGIRTTVFFKGCNLHCTWCHNPESQRSTREMLFYQTKCTGCGACVAHCPTGQSSCKLCGACTEVCPNRAREIVGEARSVEDVMREVRRDTLFYNASGGGVTFSGGECMLQIDFLKAILKECKKNGIHTAVDTAGHVPFERFKAILPDTDLWLYDVKCMNGELHKRHTGVGNEMILSNLARLLERGVRVWIRVPIVVGVNDTEEEMCALKAFLDAHGTPERVELLPYHAMGEHKYAAMGREMTAFQAPDDGAMERLRAIFQP